MGALCGLFGKSRQAFYQHNGSYFQEKAAEQIILEEVKNIRAQAPRMGCLKLHFKIKEKFADLEIMGRDSFFDFLRTNGYALRKRKTRKTTNSKHHYHKFGNLIRGFKPTGPNQLWVSDITYIDTEDGTCYLSIITDAYSHKIVGWSLGETLEAKYPIQALEEALRGLTSIERLQLIHHSDRGVQYCCHKYVDILQENNIAISMTENGDPLENAIAERVNGILKSEWLYHTRLKNLDDANEQMRTIIEFYNQERPHLSIDMLTPDQAHLMEGELKQCWRNYYSQESTEASFSFQSQR